MSLCCLYVLISSAYGLIEHVKPEGSPVGIGIAIKEHLAERLIGLAFLLLATYLTMQSAIVLLTRFHPRTSPLGLLWLSFTVAAMPLLAWSKGRAGRALGKPVLVKESKVIPVDGALAAAVLVGIGLDAVVGVW